MKIEELKKLVQDIVAATQRLSATYISEKNAPVNYACIFTHNKAEFEEMLKVANKLGPIAHETSTGPVFKIAPLSTVAGTLHILKIRRPDPKRPQRGDADFTVTDFDSFKNTYLGKPGFSLIKRPNMEMVELIDPKYDVIAYYSYPTLAEVLKIKVDQEK